MAIKENDQPTFLRGQISEPTINTFTCLEIQVPRLLSSRMLFDIDEIIVDVQRPSPALGADAQAFAIAQVIISENPPTALLDFDDSRVLAHIERMTLANATDCISQIINKGFQHWKTESHANLVPDDKIYLCVQGSACRAAHLLIAYARIKGQMAKVSIEDFEALVLSRLGS